MSKQNRHWSWCPPGVLDPQDRALESYKRPPDRFERKFQEYIPEYNICLPRASAFRTVSAKNARDIGERLYENMSPRQWERYAFHRDRPNRWPDFVIQSESQHDKAATDLPDKALECGKDYAKSGHSDLQPKVFMNRDNKNILSLVCDSNLAKKKHKHAIIERLNKNKARCESAPPECDVFKDKITHTYSLNKSGSYQKYGSSRIPEVYSSMHTRPTGTATNADKRKPSTEFDVNKTRNQHKEKRDIRLADTETFNEKHLNMSQTELSTTKNKSERKDMCFLRDILDTQQKATTEKHGLERQMNKTNLTESTELTEDNDGETESDIMSPRFIHKKKCPLNTLHSNRYTKKVNHLTHIESMNMLICQLALLSKAYQISPTRKVNINSSNNQRSQNSNKLIKMRSNRKINPTLIPKNNKKKSNKSHNDMIIKENKSEEVNPFPIGRDKMMLNQSEDEEEVTAVR